MEMLDLPSIDEIKDASAYIKKYFNQKRFKEGPDQKYWESFNRQIDNFKDADDQSLCIGVLIGMQVMEKRYSKK